MFDFYFHQKLLVQNSKYKGCVNLYSNVPLNIFSPIILTRIPTRISRASRFSDRRSDFQLEFSIKEKFSLQIAVFQLFHSELCKQHRNSSSISDQNSNQNLSRIPVIKEVASPIDFPAELISKNPETFTPILILS